MISETAIAQEVAQTLQADGWTLFFEVTLPREIRDDHPSIGDGRADIVGLRGDSLLVVECKRDLSFDLFAQAWRWRRHANAISIAVPYAKPSDGRREAFRIARDFYGFGVFESTDAGVKIVSLPRLREREDDALLYSLREEHKTYAPAGAPGGEHFSAFRGTSDGLAAFVAQNPGCTLAEALESVPHHYRSRADAETNLMKQIRKGRIPGVYVWWRGRLRSTPENARKGSAA